MFLRIQVLLWTAFLAMLGMTRFVSQQQAAEFLGISDRSVRNLISRGVLTGYKVPGLRAIRLDQREIEAKMQSIPTTIHRQPFGPNARIVTVAEVVDDGLGAE